MGNNKHTTSIYLDGFTTAERSVDNKKNIKDLDNKVRQIGNAVQPDNIHFGDGSMISTQATNAENVISNEDKRLESNIEEIRTDKQSKEFFSLNKENTVEHAINKNTSLINDMDIGNLNGRLDDLEESEQLQGKQININTAKNSQQDTRLLVIEDASKANSSAYGRYTTLESITTTQTIIKFEEDIPSTDETIFDFINGDTFEMKTAGVLEVDYQLVVESSAITSTVLSIEIYDKTNNNIIDKGDLTFNFSSKTYSASGRHILIGNIQENSNLVLRWKTDAGTLKVIESTMLFKMKTIEAVNETIYDNDVISTGDMGNQNVKQDIAELNEKKADAEQMKKNFGIVQGYVQGNIDENKRLDKEKIEIFQGKNNLWDAGFGINDAGIHPINFFSNDLKTKEKWAVKAMNELFDSIKETWLPVGTKLMINSNETPFKYGVWKNWGLLLPWATIVAGGTKGEHTNGENKKHNHLSSNKKEWQLLASGGNKGGGAVSFDMAYDKNGKAKTFEIAGDKSKDGHTTQNIYTANEGGIYNKAFGMYMGTIYVWERIS